MTKKELIRFWWQSGFFRGFTTSRK